MRYQKVVWHHDLEDEPVRLYSEVDESGRELRKVDEYADGRMDLAGDGIQTGTTRLSIAPMPSLDEISADPQFTPQAITREEFEAAWKGARRSADSGD